MAERRINLPFFKKPGSTILIFVFEQPKTWFLGTILILKFFISRNFSAISGFLAACSLFLTVWSSVKRSFLEIIFFSSPIFRAWAKRTKSVTCFGLHQTNWFNFK